MKLLNFKFIFLLLLSAIMISCGGNSKESGNTVSGPAAPQGVNAEAWDSQVTINWEAVTGATSYNIYYKESAGVVKTDTKLEDVTSPYTHTGRTNGTTYYYAITAVNANGESALSSEVSATPASGIPNNFTVTPGNAQNILNWDNVTGAVKYNIYFANSTGVSKQSTKLTTSNSNSEFLHGPIENAITRFYRVAAVYDDNSIGALSPEKSGKPMLPVGHFTKTVEYTGTSSYWGSLFDTTPAQARYMMLYLANDIKGSGYITSISLKYDSTTTSSVQCQNLTIKIGHTNRAFNDLSATFDSNIEQGQGSFKTVINGGTITIPAGNAGDIFSIQLTQPFYYNGVDNLIIDISRTSACNGNVDIRRHDIPAGASALYGTVYDTGATILADGARDQSVVDMIFSFAGGDDKLNYNGNTANFMPFTSASAGENRLQTLHLASDINGSGYITGVAFQFDRSTAAGSFTYSMRMGHTSLTALNTTFASNYESNTPVTIADNVTLTIPAGLTSGEWIWVPVTNSTFSYNGTDNLLVELIVTSGDEDVYIQTASRTGSRVSATDITAAEGSVRDVLYHIKFRFAGGMTDVITNGNATTPYPYGLNDDNKSQFLYLASELGTKGVIQKIAFRLANNTTAQCNYTNYTISLGLSDLSALTTNYVPGLNLVYTGTVSLPAGMKAGDWFEIPLSYPYSYFDLTKNLVVQTSTSHGTISNLIIIEAATGRYPDRLIYTDDPAATTGNLVGELADLRLLIE